MKVFEVITKTNMQSIGLHSTLVSYLLKHYNSALFWKVCSSIRSLEQNYVYYIDCVVVARQIFVKLGKVKVLDSGQKNW